MKVDKHGLKMKGLKHAVGFSDKMKGWGFVQISYDLDDGEILVNWHFSENEWTEYRYSNVVTVSSQSEKLSMQDIADKIYYKVMEVNNYGA